MRWVVTRGNTTHQRAGDETVGVWDMVAGKTERGRRNAVSCDCHGVTARWCGSARAVRRSGARAIRRNIARASQRHGAMASRCVTAERRAGDATKHHAGVVSRRRSGVAAERRAGDAT